MTKVTVFTKNGCPQCDMTKRVLTGEGIEFVAINVEEVQEEKFELNGVVIEKTPLDYVKEDLGFSAMPVVIVEGEEPFTGFRPDKLTEIKK